MGFKPEKYLTAGQVVETGIDGLGTIKSNVVAYK
jgi:2-keto-4-pentenoate hydratase/2-oxohepta-3-ene-1,7-dioic acid hydratase in catechol pathway